MGGSAVPPADAELARTPRGTSAFPLRLRAIALLDRLRGDAARRGLVVAILTGLLLRWLLMPTSMQNDALFMPWQASLLLRGELDVWSALQATFGEVAVRPIPWAANYPLYYVLTAGWLRVAGAVGGPAFADWRALAGTEGIGPWVLAAQTIAADLPVPQTALLWLKAPWLALDLLVGVTLWRIAPRGRGLLAWAVWSLSPLAIFSPFVMGQSDLLPVACVVLALAAGRYALASRGRRGLGLAALAGLLLGLGALAKAWPLFLLPVFALVLGRRPAAGAAALLSGLAVFALGVLPFLDSPAFVASALLNHEGTRILALPARPEGAVVGLLLQSPFLWLYGLALWLALAGPGGFRRLWMASAAVVLALLMAAEHPAYWHIWLMPFAALAVAADRGLLAWLAVDAAWAALRLADLHPDLGLRLFSVTSPGLSRTQSLHDRLAALWPDPPLDLHGWGLFAASAVWAAATAWAAWRLLRRARVGRPPARARTLCIPLLLFAALGVTLNVLPARGYGPPLELFSPGISPGAPTLRYEGPLAPGEGLAIGVAGPARWPVRARLRARPVGGVDDGGAAGLEPSAEAGYRAAAAPAAPAARSDGPAGAWLVDRDVSLRIGPSGRALASTGWTVPEAKGGAWVVELALPESGEARPLVWRHGAWPDGTRAQAPGLVVARQRPVDLPRVAADARAALGAAPSASALWAGVALGLLLCALAVGRGGRRGVASDPAERSLPRGEAAEAS